MRGLVLGLSVAITLVVAGRPSGAASRAVQMTVAPSVGRWVAPAWALRVQARVQRQSLEARRDAQLPDLMERIASGLRSGLAMGPALVAAADGSPPPLARELAPLTQAIHHGAPLAEVLLRWGSAERASADVRLVVAALELSRQAGGATARAVDRVAVTLRERRELHAEARALATQARASAGVLAVAPLLFTALVATIEPGAAAVLITTPLGGACLLLGLGLEALGAAWMRRIVRSAW